MKGCILSSWTNSFRALAKPVVLGILLAGGVIPNVDAALRTWTGAGPNAFWSTPSNWSPAGAPQDGEDLSFPAGAPRLTSTNDLSGRTFGFILFNGADSDYALNGNGITLSRGLSAVNTGRLPHVDFDVTLGDDLRFVADGGHLSVGRVVLAGHTLTLNTTTTNSSVTIYEITGVGDVVKIGPGEVLYGGPEGNSYQGATYVNEGLLRIGKGNFGTMLGVLGPLIIGDLDAFTFGRVELLRSQMIDDAAPITINHGTLDLNGWDETVGPVAFYDGSILNRSNTGVLTVLGPVSQPPWSFVRGGLITGRAFMPGDVTFDLRAPGPLLLKASLSGPGGLTKTGRGVLRLDGTNDFTGPVTVNDGMLELEEARALDGIASITLDGSGILGLRDVSIANKTLHVNSDDAGLVATFVGSSTWNGPIFLNFTGMAKFTAESSALRLLGSIQGGGGLWFGGRTVELLANNTFSGPVRSACELLLLNTGDGRPFSGSLDVGGDYFNLHFDYGEFYLPVTNPTAEVRWFRDQQNPSRPLTVRSNGFVNLNGHFEGFSGIDFHGGRVTASGAGSVFLGGDITVHPENATASLLGNVLFHIPRTFAVSNTLVTVGLYMDGTIGGPGGITKTGPGLMWIDGAGSYTDRVVIEGGVLHANSPTALGTRAAGTEVRAGGTLSLGSGADFIGEPLTLAGGGSQGTNGALRSAFDIFITNNVVLTGPTIIRTEGSSSRIQIQGAISGTGPLTKTGLGVFGFRGSTANTYSGDTVASEGTLRLSKASGITSVPGHLIVGGTTSAIAEQSASFTIIGSVTVNRGSLWNLNGLSESFTVSALEGRPPLTLNGGADVQTGAGTLLLPVGGDVVVNPGSVIGASSIISGNLGLEPGPHRFIVQSGIHIIGFNFPELDVTAAVSQTSTAAEIVKEGLGEMRLGAANSLTGPATVNEGRLTVAHVSALGTNTAGTFVKSNASLALDGGIKVVDEALTLDSTNAAALASLGPVTNDWSGPIILQRTAGISVPDPRGGLTHSGLGTLPVAISGPGGFTKSGPGAFFITGITGGGNSYSGPTTINDGLLEATRRGRALSSNVVVSGANSTLRTGRAAAFAQLSAPTVLPAGASVTIQSGALWAMNGTNFETLSRLAGNGRLTVSTAGALTITNDVSCEFSGDLSGSGALNKRGPATLQLTGNSPGYTGAATVFAGSYKVDGSIPNSPITVKILAILRGSGVVGDVTAETFGEVHVDSDGPGRQGGSMHVNSLSFVNSTILGLSFHGPHPTGGNDHVLVNNAVTLNTTILRAAFNYPPREGDVITLINKSSGGAASGAFSNFPEGGGVRMIGGVPVVITYASGNGNDATLTVTNLPLLIGGAQLVSGNGGSALVPNDCSQLRLVVTNRGAVTVSNLHGNLRSLTPGVVVTMAESSYPGLAPNARGTNVQAFQIRTEPSFPCGGGAEFELVLTGSNLPPMAILYKFPGNAGHALAFDGFGNRVAVPHRTALNAFPLTVMMWAKVNSSGHLVNKYVSSSLNGWDVFLRGGHVRAWYFASNNRFIWDGGDGLDGGNVTDGAWHHIAFTVEVTGGKLYVDGALRDSRAWTGVPGPPTTTQEVRLGMDGTGTIPFNGALDEITLWNTALSQAQIQTNMRRSLNGSEANLLAYYRGDEGSGSTVADSAPLDGNNNGTWVGAPLFVLSDVAPFSVSGGADCNSGGGACESCTVVSGQFTMNALEGTRRLSSTGLPSISDPVKPCPGFEELPDAPVRHVLHHFTNSTATERYVTARLSVLCPTPPSALGAAAYLGEFLADQPCSNYLGDDGVVGPPHLPFSFRVPPLTNFVLVVSARTTNLVCNNYTMELFGLPCPPPTLHIAKDNMPDKVLLQWSSAYPEYRLQSVNSLDGPGSINFSGVLTPPVLVGGKFAVTNAIAEPGRFFRLEAR